MVAAQIERDSRSICAQAMSGIYGWPRFGLVYALGSHTLDTYIAVPEAGWRIAEEIGSRFDGVRSLAGIAEKYRASRGLAMDVAGLHVRLAYAGLHAGLVFALLLLFFAQARVILLPRSLRRHSWGSE